MSLRFYAAVVAATGLASVVSAQPVPPASTLPIAPASGRPGARAPAPALGSLPGNGLAQHDFICAGQWDTRNPLETVYMVQNGKVVWTHTIPDRGANGDLAEFSDIHLLSNGNLLYARKTGAAEITREHVVVWNYDAPKGTEVHTAQPIGFDKVFLCQNGFPAKALLIDKASGRIEMEQVLETAPKPENPARVNGSIHGQFRHVRMTKAGTYLIAHLNLGKVVEYDRDWREIWSVPAPSAWTAVRLSNGNTLIGGNQHGYVREVNSRGEIV